jgi:hypothetical protein
MIDGAKRGCRKRSWNARSSKIRAWCAKRKEVWDRFVTRDSRREEPLVEKKRVDVAKIRRFVARVVKGRYFV